MMQYPELFSRIYQLRIRVLLEISFSDNTLKQQVMGRIFERGRQIYETDPAALTEDKLTDIAREEIQELISVPTGVDATTVLQDMSEEEQKTTILLYQENRNAEEIAGELDISREKAEALIASVKDKIEKKLGNKYIGDGITALGLLIGMFRAQPVTVLPAAVSAAIVTPGISAAVPTAIEAGGHGGAVSAVSSTASSTATSTAVSASASQAATVSGGKAVQSSVVYGASNAGPASTAAGTTSAAAAKTAAAGTAAKTAAAAGGATAAKVAATAAVAVTVVGGGGYAGYKYYESRTNEPEPAPEVIADPEKEEEISTPVPTEVIVEETEEPAEAVWIKEPQFEGIRLYDLGDNANLDLLSFFYDESGYPSEWPGRETAGNAVLLLTENNVFIYDFDGDTVSKAARPSGTEEQLRFSVIPAYSDESRYSFTAFQYNNDDIVFNEDLSVYSNDTSIYGFDLLPVIIAVKDGDPVIFQDGYALMNGEYRKMTEDEIKEYTNSGDIICAVIDDQLNEKGIAVIGTGGIIATSDYFYAITKTHNWYANHYCFVSRTKTNLELSIEDSGPYAAFRADKGETVTDFIYSSFKFFEDGYCPVKKNGYWGFIDEEGKEVTDFIFEDASTLYQGRTFVKVNGKYGILDLKTTLENGVPVTSETIETAGVIPAETDNEESGKDDPYVGRYYEPTAGRIWLFVEKIDGRYNVSIVGPGESSNHYYYFSGDFDKNGRMDYTNCTMASDVPGEIMQNIEYSYGSGYLVINGDTVIWHNYPPSDYGDPDGFDIEMIRYTEE